MAKRRPINAEQTAVELAPRASTPSQRQRRRSPAALKAIAGLVIVAVAFLAAAIVGGSGSGQDSDTTATPLISAGGQGTETTESPVITASNNTTRIGASDPAATGAAVALAVYPSTNRSQRPATVTLVDETWQGAVAAAVLMAPPIRAPLLVSSADGPPPASEQALSALQPKDVLHTAGAAAADQAAEIERLRESLFGGPPKHLVIAAEDDPSFAVPAAAWAARSADPVLYSQTDKLPAATAAVLRDHPRVPVYVLGPTSVISSSAMREIEQISRRVRRVAGRTPATNALALARYSDGSFGWNVNDPGHGFVIARGDAPLNAALAAPLSATGTWGPLLLTESADKLPRAVRQYLLDVKPGYTTDPTRAFYNHAWIVGGEGEIDANQQAEISQLAELAKVGGEE
jgi:hypothetical protein